MQFMQKSCIRWASCAITVVLLQQVSAQSTPTVHIAHCLAGCPAGTAPANEIVVRHLFAASINYQTGLADWVAYRVLPGTVGVASLLQREWLTDELLEKAAISDQESGPDFTQPDISNLQDRDYRVTEIIVNIEDRGRLAPMSSFAGTPYWEELNYLSNMAPVPGDLRQGPWSRLDQAVNELATKIGEVYVVSGPLYGNTLEGDAATTSPAPMAAGNAPTAYFKFIATASGQTAFVFPADLAKHRPYCDRVVSQVEIELRSGLTMLPQRTDEGAENIYSLLGCE